MTKRAISCIIPVHNGQTYIAETIESVLQQSVPTDEVIVVDDGSTDNTVAICQRFGSRVRIVKQLNAGPAVARNTGISNASGQFITFQDADDLWTSEKNEVQLGAFADDPDLMLCVCHVENFLSPDVPTDQHLPEFSARAKPMAGYTTPCLMARREAFDVVGVFNARLKHTDAGEWFKRARALKVRERLLPDVLVRRRLHATNRSRIFADESRAEFLQMLKTNIDQQRKGGASPA